MSWTPITGTPIQYNTNSNELASGYYLKLYLAGTTTPYSMATDSSGVVRLAKCKISASGYPITNPLDDSTVFIPHVDSPYRVVLFETETDADANNTANAAFNIDNVDPAVSQLASSKNISIRGTNLQAQDDYDRSPRFTDGDGFTAGAGPHVITAPSGWTPSNGDMRFYKLASIGVVTALTPTVVTSTTFTLAETLLSDDTVYMGDEVFRGLGTAAQADIVGTVSESGGVPTGAIIEQSSNANGDYTKFADGTLICRGSFSQSVTVGANITKDFPVGFIGTPSCNWWWYRSGFIAIDVNFQGAESATRGIINFNATATAVFGFTAIGRWF